jgi:hypothetical protein
MSYYLCEWVYMCARVQGYHNDRIRKDSFRCVGNSNQPGHRELEVEIQTKEFCLYSSKKSTIPHTVWYQWGQQENRKELELPGNMKSHCLQMKQAKPGDDSELMKCQEREFS